jgi:hypothetical protein
MEELGCKKKGKKRKKREKRKKKKENVRMDRLAQPIANWLSSASLGHMTLSHIDTARQLANPSKWSLPVAELDAVASSSLALSNKP